MILRCPLRAPSRLRPGRSADRSGGAPRARAGSTLVAVVVIAALVLGGLVVLLRLVESSRSVAIAYNDKLVANNLAEAATNRGLEMLRLVFDPADVDAFRPDVFEMPDAAFAELVATELMPRVNGPEGVLKASLRRAEDGRYRVLEFRRDAARREITIRGEGVFESSRVGRAVSSIVEIDIALLFDQTRYGAAILSTSPEFGLVGGGGKPRAQDGNVVLERQRGTMAVMGRMMANGSIRDGFGALLTPDNIAPTAHTQHPPGLAARLDGTPSQLPAAAATGPEAVFDFARFIAAAEAGAGQRFPSLQDFAAAMTAQGELAGIIVVDVDPGVFARRQGQQVVLTEPILSPRTTGGGQTDAVMLPEIAVRGMLLFNVAPTFTHGGATYETPASFRITVESPVRINPVDDVDVAQYLADVDAWAAATAGGDVSLPEPGAPGSPNPFLDPDFPRPAPWNVVLPAAFDPFLPGDDLPALAFSRGTIDLDGPVNVGGVVFGPHFVEIENRAQTKQYLWGMLMAGGGVYIQDRGGPGKLGIAFGRGAVDRLATANLLYRTPTVVAWRQVR